LRFLREKKGETGRYRDVIEDGSEIGRGRGEKRVGKDSRKMRADNPN